MLLALVISVLVFKGLRAIYSRLLIGLTDFGDPSSTNKTVIASEKSVYPFPILIAPTKSRCLVGFFFNALFFFTRCF